VKRAETQSDLPGRSSDDVSGGRHLLLPVPPSTTTTAVGGGGSDDDDVLRGPGDSTPESAWSSTVVSGCVFLVTPAVTSHPVLCT